MQKFKVSMVGDGTLEFEIKKDLSRYQLIEVLHAPMPTHLQHFVDVIRNSNGFLMTGRSECDFIALGMAINGGHPVWTLSEPVPFVHARLNHFESFDDWKTYMKLDELFKEIPNVSDG